MADVELFENDGSFLQGGGHKELGGFLDDEDFFRKVGGKDRIFVKCGRGYLFYRI